MQQGINGMRINNPIEWNALIKTPITNHTINNKKTRFLLEPNEELTMTILTSKIVIIQFIFLIYKLLIILASN